jgi:hypothetical protein
VASAFRQAGLQPGGDDGGWLQHYPLQAQRVSLDGARLTVARQDETRELELLEDGVVSGYGGEDLQHAGNRLVIAGQCHAAGEANAVAEEAHARWVEAGGVRRDWPSERRKDQAERRLLGDQPRRADGGERRRRAADFEKPPS